MESDEAKKQLVLDSLFLLWSTCGCCEEKLQCILMHDGETHLYSPKVSSFMGRASESTSLSSLSFTVERKKAVSVCVCVRCVSRWRPEWCKCVSWLLVEATYLHICHLCCA